MVATSINNLKCYPRALTIWNGHPEHYEFGISSNEGSEMNFTQIKYFDTLLMKPQNENPIFINLFINKYS